MRYGALRVLHPTDLSVRAGEFLTILGPSGSGKTTILKIVGGFVSPTEGRLLLDGQDISRMPVTQRPFNTVFQDYALFPHMTAEQNVGYGLMIRGRGRDEIKRRVAEVLSIVGLADRARSLPKNLSGGQKQRVALARAIICEPRVILLDEPLSALDAELRRQMQTFLKDLQRRIRTTFLFVTHDQEEAITMSDRVVVMNHGRIEQVGAPRELYYRPATEFVAGFFGDNNIIEGRAVAGGEVETPIGRLDLQGDLQPGQQVRLAIRPEHLLLGGGQSRQAAEMTFSAQVFDVDFVGALTHLRLRVGDGQTLKLKVPTPQLHDDIRPGCDVSVHWSRENMRALRPTS
ncbi:ABC transporter ATP-binding protein [Dongia sedimenti]|uniref:ABC transporter ATP-binding protein n=1 Tax=Dongia sedimenti TaxID=3064282 RepID=A0ABU0YQM9_9PROT|nr:ABC transporter ATP-binding protein [Rhodospirillaceae bacterium R-7]